MVGDDPGGLSSTNEQDSRHVARALDLPLLEPATFQEAKDMAKWAFEVSEAIGNVCMLRSVTRISHARGNVVLGELPSTRREAHFDTSRSYAGIGGMADKLHRAVHEKIPRIISLYESSPFNFYLGPQEPELLDRRLWKRVALCNGGGQDARPSEVRGRPQTRYNMASAARIFSALTSRMQERSWLWRKSTLFSKAISKSSSSTICRAADYKFFGKASGHIKPYGEINVDVAIQAITAIMGMEYESRDRAYEERSRDAADKYIPPRGSQLCPGCPHRATYWAIKNALRIQGDDGVVVGDIGCYSMGLQPSGFEQVKMVHAMGSGMGVASGLGKLDRFNFKQPVLAVCGDSTFFHAVIPALINAVHSESDVVLVVLDNSGTAMTGFQPHPGTDKDAMGVSRPEIRVEKICEALGVPDNGCRSLRRAGNPEDPS